MELVSTPDNPAPPGAIVAPVGAADGVILRVARWAPQGALKGTVCVFTGRGEFIEKYFETIGKLIERRFAVVAMDWRGQGLSGRALRDSRKGHVDDFALFERDVEALDQQVLRFLCPPPYFALAHSMGGAIVLSQAMAGASPFSRIVLTAPMLDLHGLRHPGIVRGVVEMADILGLGGAWIPRGKGASSMTAPFEGNVLTGDAGRYARNAGIVAAAPHLAVGDPTIGWVNAAFRLMAQFDAGRDIRNPATPVLAFAAEDDRVVSSPAIHRVVGGFRTGAVIALPGARHEILQETDATLAMFWAAFDAFVPGQTKEGEALLAAQDARVALARSRSWPARLARLVRR